MPIFVGFFRRKKYARWWVIALSLCPVAFRFGDRAPKNYSFVFSAKKITTQVSFVVFVPVVSSENCPFVFVFSSSEMGCFIEPNPIGDRYLKVSRIDEQKNETLTIGPFPYQRRNYTHNSHILWQDLGIDVPEINAGMLRPRTKIFHVQNGSWPPHIFS